MTIIQTLKNEIMRACLSANIDVNENDIHVEHPVDITNGDYSCNIAMIKAKQIGMLPRDMADKIIIALRANKNEHVEKVDVAGAGFINIFLNKKFFSDSIGVILNEKGEFGTNTRYGKQTWVIEHTSPNPNKAMHIGHLRNNVIGMTLGRLAKANGVTVKFDMIDNNRGIAIAKLMWGFLKFARLDDTTPIDLEHWRSHKNKWHTPESKRQCPDHFIDALYVLGAQDFGEDKSTESRVRQMVVDWENKDSMIRELWRHVIDYSYAGQKFTLNRLGSNWDKEWHEDEIYEKGKGLVSEGLSKGIFKKLEDGAILTNLSSYNIPDTIVQKSDGTSLYITQDIALTKLKKETYHADKLFWVIGPEQSLAMKQVFAICEQLGIGKVSDYTHISYGFMGLKDGAGNFEKMSSREGTTLFIDDLIDAVKVSFTKKERIREMKELSLPKEEKRRIVLDKEGTLEKIALGAVKFSILRVGRIQDMAFDIESSIDTEGDSGPYLQYTHARIQSLLEKANIQGLNSLQIISPVEWKTTDVERTLYKYPEIITSALDEYAPQYVATYLIELARAFNTFYGSTKILDSESSPDVITYKLAITKAVGQVIKNGLGILGIDVVERM